MSCLYLTFNLNKNLILDLKRKINNKTRLAINRKFSV
jgi:hypothetical protein